MSFYSWVLLSIFVASAGTFVLLLFVVAPYGRHMRTGWGIALPSRWAWALMEAPAALVIAFMAIYGESRDAISLLFIALWELHYLYRTVLYPAMIRDAGRRTFPLILTVIAVLYNCANGYVNGFHLFVAAHRYPATWLGDPRFIAGMALFAAGMATHISSDRILQRLRMQGSSRYAIPYGGMFRYVSCPNYLGEIAQWFGFALATWSLAGLSFAVFTTANLLPRAPANHRWYRRQFPDYPEQRKAILPAIL